MRKTIHLALSMVVGLLLLWWLLRGVRWDDLWASLRGADMRWLLLNQVAIWASFFTRIQRWNYIVRAVEPVPFGRLFSATQIGFLANFTLPLRIGEPLRALVLTRLTAIPFSKSLALVALDRVTDLVGLAVVMSVAMLGFTTTGEIRIPQELIEGFHIQEVAFPATRLYWAELSMAGLLAATIAALVWLYVNQKALIKLSDTCLSLVSKKLAQRAHGVLTNFAEGLHIFRSKLDMAKSLAFSLMTWGCFLVGTVFLLAAFHINWPWYTPFMLQALVAVFISAPGTPGFIGQFHFPIVLTLMVLVPQMKFADAVAVAIVAHLLNLIPIVLTGIFCLAWENLGLLDLSGRSAVPRAARGKPD